ncbi:MAG TPA: EAL domain-containing protein [Vicinamibacterales bacterium]|nr:EAL domain-containing protein [Vicinamibacterales bacterium]
MAHVAQSAPTTPQYGHGIPTLLLIEAVAPHRRTVRDVLDDASGILHVEHVTSLKDGLAKLQQHPFSAALLDLTLPECRDLSAIDELRRVSPKIAIMILSPAGDQALARRGIERGANDAIVTDQIDSRSLIQLIAMMFERRALDEQKFVERERAEVTLNSIGDAVMTTDTLGNVTYLNAEAEGLTGWSRSEAFARPLAEVFDVTDGLTGQHAQDPSRLAIEHNKKVRLKGSYILVGRDGNETAIEHSAAPIHDRQGNILGAVIVFRDVIVSRERRLQMLHLAEHDALTDLPNRLLLNDRLARAVALARRYGRRLAVLFLDCDRFKHINDTLGHAVGDQVLRSIAKRLTTCVRESDTVSRHGGDEFLVLLSEVDEPADAGLIAEKIVRSIAEPHFIAGHELSLTASVGIALYPEDGQDAQSLIMRADTAMYHAKNTGRNRVGFYRADMEAPAIKRSSIENELRNALDKNELELYYQPTIDLETGVISGAEALMRWRHPERGIIPPDQFIPAAEASGLIIPMGRWALREACRQAKAWQNAGLPPIPIAVNVSALQFRTAGFLEDIQGFLQETGLPSQYLQLELTESALMVDTASTTSLLEVLKHNGLVLKVDDFGTGPSSLSYLQRCPVDVLKIDQSFVQEIAPWPGGAPIVRAVIAMGKSLGCRIVAEGVETKHQFAYLRSEHCDEGQGYHFSPPVNAAAFERLLSNAPYAIPLLEN